MISLNRHDMHANPLFVRAKRAIAAPGNFFNNAREYLQAYVRINSRESPMAEYWGRMVLTQESTAALFLGLPDDHPVSRTQQRRNKFASVQQLFKKNMFRAAREMLDGKNESTLSDTMAEYWGGRC